MQDDVEIAEAAVLGACSVLSCMGVRSELSHMQHVNLAICSSKLGHMQVRSKLGHMQDDVTLAEAAVLGAFGDGRNVVDSPGWCASLSRSICLSLSVSLSLCISLSLSLC